MNCERIEKRLIAYMDGRASAAQRREVEEHLAGCSACRTRVKEFGALWGMLDEMPAAEITPGFDARVRARIAAEPRPSLWSWLVPSPRLAFAATLLLILSVWVSSFPPNHGNPVPAPTAPASSEAEFRMIRDLPVLEDYDVLANFEALSELPRQLAANPNQEM